MVIKKSGYKILNILIDFQNTKQWAITASLTNTRLLCRTINISFIFEDIIHQNIIFRVLSWFHDLSYAQPCIFRDVSDELFEVL